MKTLLLIALVLAFIGLVSALFYFFNLLSPKNQKWVNEKHSNIELN